MKPVPNVIRDSAPEGTVWFGGPGDRLTMSLRVHAKEADWSKVSTLLGCQPDGKRGAWLLEAPPRLDGDMDAQVEQLISRTSTDLSAWAEVASIWRVDIFCGLFLERQN